jgi:hypothetical protein
MTLNLIKLSVGVTDVDHLWRIQQGRLHQRDGRDVVYGWTRMMPKRRDEVLDGGSLYWVIKLVARVRQRVLDLEPAIDEEDGRPYCRIVLDPPLIAVSPRSWKPFQGWRYLASADAPTDLGAAPGAGAEDEPMPAALVAELRALGLV